MGTCTGRKNCTEEMKHTIFNMDRTGMTQNNVAIHFSISRSTVSKILKRSKGKENCINKKRGLEFKISEAAIRILQFLPLKNSKKPLFVTVNEFRVSRCYKLSIKTIRKYVYKCESRNYAEVAKPYLLPRHFLASKRGANMHLNWYISQWGKAAFSDECTCTIKLTPLGKRV